MLVSLIGRFNYHTDAPGRVGGKNDGDEARNNKNVSGGARLSFALPRPMYLLSRPSRCPRVLFNALALPAVGYTFLLILGYGISCRARRESWQGENKIFMVRVSQDYNFL